MLYVERASCELDRVGIDDDHEVLSVFLQPMDRVDSGTFLIDDAISQLIAMIGNGERIATQHDSIGRIECFGTFHQRSEIIIAGGILEAREHRDASNRGGDLGVLNKSGDAAGRVDTVGFDRFHTVDTVIGLNHVRISADVKVATDVVVGHGDAHTIAGGRLCRSQCRRI